IRLRLQVLLFNHLQLCKNLFSQPLFLSHRRAVKAARQTTLSAEALRKEIYRLSGAKRITQEMVSKAGFKGTFQQLQVLDLEKWFLQLLDKASRNSPIGSHPLTESAPDPTPLANAISYLGKRKKPSDE